VNAGVPTPETVAAEPPLVSILIPAWGCKAFIAETIRSALVQTYANTEVVVVEDCGSDGTYEEALSQRDPRLRVVRNRHQLGQYGNKNRALELAHGSLIKFLDGDDALVPDAVDILVSAWRSSGPGTGLVFGQFEVIDASGRYVGRPSRWGLEGRRHGLEVLEQVLLPRLPGSRFGNVTPHLFERATLERAGGFPNDNAGPGDLDTFLRILCVSDVAFTERRTAKYRIHATSMSAKTFGVKECGDYARMVQRFEYFCEGLENGPEFLKDPRFFREWRVWAGGHNIFASLMQKFRQKPNQYDAIRAMYIEQGLEREFKTFVCLRLPGYLWRTAATKIRRIRGMPDAPPLFRAKR
jgi:glycosyltransferase involved in cell wall biosynthesis